MNKLEVELLLRNPTFQQGDYKATIANFLRLIADNIEKGITHGTVLDENKNTIGSFIIK